MKRFLPLAAALLLAAGCNLRTATYSDEQATPLGEGQTDSLLQSVSIEYPVKGAKAEVLAKIEDGILNTVFDMEEIPGSVEETALRYEDNLKDEYFNEYEGLESGFGAKTWEDHVNGYFSGRYKQYLSYMVELYSDRGGAHGISTMTPVVFDKKTGEIVPEEAFFADGYREPVAALLQAHLPEALEGDEEALAAVSDPGLVVPNGLYEVTKDGVTWYYQPYVIAPFSVGVISISIPWNELKPYVR
ncbi:MAG: DUF3298 domain-containing protein [Bacteroidales bacterium]|nr:DUF3298 domain-containing protein [Bacteroidales bacterium]